MPPSSPKAMHVAIVRVTRKGKTYVSALLRQSYRDEQGRVQKRTLANLSDLPGHVIALIQGALKGKQYVEVDAVFDAPVRSRLHGGVQAVLDTFGHLGLAKLIAPRRSRERDLVCAMIAARILRPQTKLATARWWHTTTLPEAFGVADADADELYAAMDWLAEQQQRIQDRLARRWLGEGSVVLFDLTSTWLEGACCPLAEFGYSRDGKRGKMQVTFGLLCDSVGRPVSVSVYSGSTRDPDTLLPEIERIRTRFGLERVVVTGDRGMVVKATIEVLRALNGVDWITALRSTTIRKLVRAGLLDPLDRQNLFELEHPDFPGERLVACHNPRLAQRRRNTRESLLQATETDLEAIAARVARGTLSGAAEIGLKVGEVINRRKMKKHFLIDITDHALSVRRDTDTITTEAALDGIYVIRTSLSHQDMEAGNCVRTYKALTRVERAFRTLKTTDLHVRPIHHRLEHRVRAHIFLVMLGYVVEWHMRKAWLPLLFADPELDTLRQTRDPVLPAQRSAQAEDTALTGLLPDGTRAHSFRTLLDSLDTIVTSTVPVPGTASDSPRPTIDVTTVPNAHQNRAYQLLKEISKM